MESRSIKGFSTILYLTFALTLFVGCKKQDNTDTVDITAFKWKMQNIKVNGFKTKIKDNVDFLNGNPYSLIFYNDSVFQLNTSVNHAIGNYKIYEKGEIVISDYFETTLVYTTDDKIDSKLLVKKETKSVGVVKSKKSK